MSANPVTVYQLVCDKCGFKPYPNAFVCASLKMAKQKFNWHIKPITGERYCPKCAPLIERKEEL